MSGVLLFLPSLCAQSPAPGTAIANEKFNLDRAGEDQVGYAQTIKVGSTIYISGSVGEGGDMRTQLRQADENIGNSPARYGATLQNVVKKRFSRLIKQKDARRDFYQATGRPPHG